MIMSTCFGVFMNFLWTEIKNFFSAISNPEFLSAFSQILEAIAWPGALLIFTFIFRRTLSLVITELSKRLASAGKDGLTFHQSPQDTVTKEENAQEYLPLEQVLKDQPIIHHYLRTHEKDIEQ